MKRRSVLVIVLAAWTLWSSSATLDPKSGQMVSSLSRMATFSTKEECEFALDREIARYAARNWEVKGSRHVVSNIGGVVATFGCLPDGAKPQQ